MKPSILELELPADRHAPGNVRRVVAECDPSVLPESVRPDVALVVSELITNAIRHAQLLSDDLIRVALEGINGKVRVEVEDPGPCFTLERMQTRDPPQSGRGIGLFLVESLADRWGVERRDGSCLVWAEVATDRD